jgi:hypothetical protein
MAILNKQKCHFFFLLKNQRTGGQNRSYLGGWYSGRVNIVQILCTMRVNGKMRPVETVPGVGEGG